MVGIVSVQPVASCRVVFRTVYSLCVVLLAISEDNDEFA